MICRLRSFPASTITAAVLIVTFCVVSQAEELVGVITQSEMVLTKEGYVYYRPEPQCVGKCASLGDPYVFNVTSAGRLSDLVLQKIQELGFSLNPEGKQSKIQRCEQIEEVRVEARQWKNIWTDFIQLNEEFLSKVNATWAAIGLTNTSKLIYELQIVGCYAPLQDGAREVDRLKQTNLEPLRKPNPYMFGGVYSDSGVFNFPTKLKLVIAIIMKKRGRKGASFPVTENVNPKPLADGIRTRFEEVVDRISE